MIYTNGRSGSNALTNLLKQHPNVLNYGEVLGPWTTPGRLVKPLFRGRHGTARYLDFVLGSRPAFTTYQALSYASRRRSGRPVRYRRWGDITSLGVKEFAVNLHRFGLADYLERHTDLRLVVLLRENTVDRYVSVERLRQTGVVATRTDVVEPQESITIAPERVVADLDRMERENQLLRQAAEVHRGPTMLLRYEEYFSLGEQAHAQVNADIQEFLGVRPVPIITAHRKLRQGRLADSIANYPEFREAVAATRHAVWLTD